MNSEEIKKEINCKYFAIYPFPSATPELFQGWIYTCKKHNKDADENICKDCKEKIKWE